MGVTNFLVLLQFMQRTNSEIQDAQY